MTTAEQFYKGQNRLNAENNPNLYAEYDIQTNRLELDAMEFTDLYDEHFPLPQIVFLLRRSYKELLTHSKVLHENRMRTNTDVSSGFCAPSTYIIYTMTGADKVWEIHHAGRLHWWLVHKQTNKIFDVTYSQFEPYLLKNIYQNGSKCKDVAGFFDDVQDMAKQLAHCAGIR